MQKFDTPAPISAVLDIPAGRVQFIAADRADTTVEIRPADASKGRDVKAAEQTKAGYSDGVLRIEAPAKNQYLGSTGAIEVTVQLPAGSRVQAKAASAEFRVVGRLGDVTFEGAYGQTKVDEAASARLTAVAGDVSVGRLTGAAEISTTRATSASPRPYAARSCCAPRPARSRSAPPPESRPPSTPAPPPAGSTTRSRTTAPPQPGHPRDHLLRRHHRPQPLTMNRPNRAVRPAGLTALNLSARRTNQTAASARRKTSRPEILADCRQADTDACRSNAGDQVLLITSEKRCPSAGNARFCPHFPSRSPNPSSDVPATRAGFQRR